MRWVRGEAGGRWCSCDEDTEGPEPDGRGCAVGPTILNGSGNARWFRGGGMKKGGATGVPVLSSAPWHSQYRAMRDCPQYSTGQQPSFPWLAIVRVG